MKATIEIPDAIFQAISSCAARRGQNFATTLTEIINRGIEAVGPETILEKPRLERDPDTGLLVIANGQRPAPGCELTSDQIAEIMLNQEVEWHREASGY